jgi:carboxypeptidase PM20D1
VQIPTVSRLDETAIDWAQFDRFVDELERLYPLVHSTLERDRVAGHSLLFRWRGADSARPAVLMAHYDVVPATDEGWEHPPFAAELEGSGDDLLIWGRGTIDDKGSLVAILEAVESSLAAGFVPTRDVYLSFGHNEETTGAGATAIVDELESRGVSPGLVLDEGGAVVERVFPGVDAPLAVIGVSEKGISTLTLTVEQEGGHASTPPRMTATARLARAIVRLQARPFPARFGPTTRATVSTVARHARQPFRFVFSQLWLTAPLLLRVLSRSSEETSAMVRTTAAVTMLRGSSAVNALAETASASINLRVAVGSSVAEAVAHVSRAIDDDKVRIEVEHPNEPSPVSPSTGPAWDALAAAVGAVYPTAVVTPYVQLGASDSRHFSRLSDTIYRFTPFELSKAERGTLHARNERLHVATWLRGIEFYRELISRL